MTNACDKEKIDFSPFRGTFAPLRTLRYSYDGGGGGRGRGEGEGGGEYCVNANRVPT